MFSWNSGPTKSKSVGALAWSEQPTFSSAKLQDFFENLVESSTETTPFSGSYMEKVPLNKGSTASCFQVQSSKIFWEIGRELHRNSTFMWKLCEKRAIEQRLHIFIAHKCGSFRFRRSKVWELSIETLNPCFQVQSCRTFSEIGRELHRNSTFKRKLYGESTIEQRLGKLLLHTLIARHVKTEAPHVFQGHFF